MNDARCTSKWLAAAGAALAIFVTHHARAAETTAGNPTASRAIAKNPPLKVGLVAFAKSRGFSVCSNELDALDQNLFRDSDYSLRAFFAENNVNARPFSALIDSRKTNPQGNYVRALTNIVITPGDVKAAKCTVMYEQTLYHDQHCDTVRQQMASFAPESGTTSFGSITFDLLRNMTLTIIPVGSAQCISVVKEVAY